MIVGGNAAGSEWEVNEVCIVFTLSLSVGDPADSEWQVTRVSTCLLW